MIVSREYSKKVKVFTNKKARVKIRAFLEEHLENSSPLIIEEVHRWRDLLRDDYLDYKYREKRS